MHSNSRQTIRKLASELRSLNRKDAGDVIQMASALIIRKARSVGQRYEDNDPATSFMKDVAGMSVAAAQIAEDFNLPETAARFQRAAKLALRTKSTPESKSVKAKVHADNLVNGAALIHNGIRSDSIRKIREGLYRIGASLSDMMEHYGNPQADSMFGAAHQAASRGI